MALQKYIHQLNPRQESRIDHVERLQNLRELTISPDYQSKGVFNPFYVLNIPEDDIRPSVGDGEIKYKCVDVGSGAFSRIRLRLWILVHSRTHRKEIR